jgi:phosphate-selective porin OprO/OprP
MALFNTLRAASSVAAIAAGLMAVSVPAYADMESLLEKLLAKGILSQDEFNEMRQDVREARREAAMDKVSKANAAKTELQGVWKDGFGFTTGDGQHSIKLTGRIQADYRWKEAPADYNLGTYGTEDRDTASGANGFELRRARFGVQGFMYKDINYKAEWNLVGGAPVVDEAFANFAYYKPVQLTVGRFKQPFSLEQLASSNALDFAERSYVDQNGVPAKKLGAMLSGEPKKGITYAASVFQQGMDELTLADGRGTQYAGRLTGNLGQLFNVRDTVLHVGVGYVGGSYELRPTQSDQTASSYETVTRATIAGFRTMNRGLSNIYRAQVAGQDVGLFTNTVAGTVGLPQSRLGLGSESTIGVDQDLLGLEAAVAYKSFKIQGEYTNNQLGSLNKVVSGTAASTTVDAGSTATNAASCRAGVQPGVNLNNGNYASGTTSQLLNDCQQGAAGDVNSWYVQGVWNITGEKWADRYEGGVFKGIKPMTNFKPGVGWGAFQLGLRYSKFDASSLNVTGSGSRIQSGRSFAGTDQITTVNATNGTLVNEQAGNANSNVNGDRGKMNSEVESYGIGLNWLLNPNAKIMVEWTHTNFGGNFVPLDTYAASSTATKVPAAAVNNSTGKVGVNSEDLVSIRAQVNF